MSRIMHRLAGLLIALSTAGLIAAPLVIAHPTHAIAQGRIAVSSEFRLALEPYGEFRSLPRWGEVWVPVNVSRDWRPYTVGHWVYSDDYGWYWVSDDAEAQWGWITFHYGRWIYDRDVGWAWIPGNEWGPAFVDWRRGHDYIGWAPMPPDEIIAEVRDDPIYWDFVPARAFLSPRLASVIVPVRESETFIRETVIENRTVFVRDRHFAVNPGIAPGIVAAAIGRPVRTFEVHPVVLAGTANIAGATTVRANELRTNRNSVGRQAAMVRETTNTIQPARNVRPPQPLARGENGRLGANPPRAARGEVGSTGATTGAAPAARQNRPGEERMGRPGEQRGPNLSPSRQSPAAQTGPRTPSGTTGQGASRGTTQPNIGNERRGQGAQERERGGAQNLQNRARTPSRTTGQAPSPTTQPNFGNERRGQGAPERERGMPPHERGAQFAPSQRPSPGLREQGPRPGTTGAAPAAPREPSLNQERRALPNQQNRAAPGERNAPPAMPHERAAPPSAARPAPPQSPAARGGMPPQAPAARGPEPSRSAPAAQAPRAAPSTTGAGPRGGGGPHGERR